MVLSNMRPARMCSHLLSKGHCEWGDKCTFAHKFSELQLPDEESIFQRNSFSLVDWSSVRNKKIASKSCNRAEKCTFKGCTYAHTIQELSPIICKSNERCYKIQTCPFFHTAVETKKQYIQRLNIDLRDEDEEEAEENIMYSVTVPTLIIDFSDDE